MLTFINVTKLAFYVVLREYFQFKRKLKSTYALHDETLQTTTFSDYEY